MKGLNGGNSTSQLLYVFIERINSLGGIELNLMRKSVVLEIIITDLRFKIYRAGPH